jgi:hypothetical protein
VAGFLILIWVVLWVAAFVDALLTDPTRVRNLPKIVWLIGIVLLGGFAAIAWFIFGRPRREGSVGSGPSPLGARFSHPSARRTDESGATGWTLGGTGGRRSGPIAPDDDPDFLRSLGQRRPEPPGEPGSREPGQPA